MTEAYEPDRICCHEFEQKFTQEKKDNGSPRVKITASFESTSEESNESEIENDSITIPRDIYVSSKRLKNAHILKVLSPQSK